MRMLQIDGYKVQGTSENAREARVEQDEQGSSSNPSCSSLSSFAADQRVIATREERSRKSGSVQQSIGYVDNVDYPWHDTIILVLLSMPEGQQRRVSLNQNVPDS